MVLPKSSISYAVEALNSQYLKSIGMLMTGTTIAQLINILILPVLTRLYTPIEFDQLTVFMSATVIVSLGASLGYSLAIPIAQTDQDANNLSWIAAICTIIIASIIAIALALIPNHYIGVVAQGKFGQLVPFLLPLSCLAAALSINLENLFVQQRQFKVISTVRIIQAITGGGLQTALFFLDWGALGLIVGFLAMSAVPFILLVFLLLARKHIASPSFKLLRETASKYSRFPKYTAVESFSNAGAVYFPLIVISTFSAGAQAAYLMLALRVMLAPLMLLGRAVSQVTQSRVVEWTNSGQLSENIARVMRNLISLTLGGVVTVMIAAPFITELFFGSNWAPVGIYFTMILPCLYMNLLSYILMPLVYAKNGNNIVMITTIIGMVFRTAIVLAAVSFGGMIAALSYSISGFLYYLVAMLVFSRSLNIPFIEIWRLQRFGQIFIILPLVCFGLVYLVTGLK